MRLKLKTLLMLMFLLASFPMSAQTGFVKQWDKRFGGDSADGLWSILALSDGACLLVGTSSSEMEGNKSQPSRGSSDMWIVKVDAFGNKVWDKRYGSFQSDVLITARQTHDLGFILGGWSGGPATGDKSEPGRGSSDYWVVKIDSTGNKQWDKTFGGTGEDFLWTLNITQDGGYILGGTSCSPISGDKSEDCWDPFYQLRDYWVVRTDSNGNKLWDRRFGGTDDDFLASVIQTQDQGFLLAGRSLSDSSGNKTQANWGGADDSDYWLVKLDSLGQEQWQHHYGTDGYEGLWCSIIEVNNGYVLGGFSGGVLNGDNSENKYGYWLIKINPSGIKEWDRNWGSLVWDEFRNLDIVKDKGFIFSGFSYTNFAQGDKTENNMGNKQTWLVKTDSLGNKEWDKTIFTINENEGIALSTVDGCYVVGCVTSDGTGGYKTQPNWNSPYPDYWVLKFCMNPSSITDAEDNANVSVFPTPFSSELSIAIQQSNLQQAEITIISSIGQVIYKGTENHLSSSYVKSLDLSYLPNGIYFLHINLDGVDVVKRVLKQ